MKTQVLGLMLALSVLFNVFFAVGYLKARAQLALDDPADRVPRLVTDELGLDDGQARIFRRLRSSMADDDAVYREGIALIRQEMAAELNGRDPDLEKVRRLSAREAELHRQRRLAGSQRFEEFISLLDPEQRHRLSRRFRHGRPGSREPSPEVMKRFDADQDGELSDTERGAMFEFVQQRHREREERWRERAARFDVNGDGRLDAEERAALRKEYGEGRGPGPGRGGRRGRPGDRPGERPGERSDDRPGDRSGG